MFWLALQGFDGLQDSEEPRTQVAALEARETGHSAEIDAIENNGPELLDGNRHFEHQLAVVGVEKKVHEAPDVKPTKAVTDPKGGLANAKEALRVLQSRAFWDWSAMRGAMENHDCVQAKLTNAS